MALQIRQKAQLAGILFAGLMLAACAEGAREHVTSDNTAETSAKWQTRTGAPPIVIAHRGASGERPEHTLAAYELAIDQGADFIEPDLVITKDGHLVARHDRYLSGSTNIAELTEFADRKTVKQGHEGADWFVEDFTLAELKTLRARQPRDGRSRAYDDLYEIPTFEDVLALAVRRSAQTGRRIGIYPETKQPAALEALGLRFDAPLLAALEKHGYGGADDPVFIQSFEAENLKRLKTKTEVRLVYLVAGVPEETIDEIASFASGLGLYKLMLGDAAAGDTGLLKQAHEAGLDVHIWTLRDDDTGASFAGDINAELDFYLELGVDGLFTDFPATALAAREAR